MMQWYNGHRVAHQQDALACFPMLNVLFKQQYAAVCLFAFALFSHSTQFKTQKNV